MGSGEMSKRAHWMLRLAAVGLIGATAWLPRGSTATSQLQAAQIAAQAQASQVHAATAAGAVEARTVHASVASR